MQLLYKSLLSVLLLSLPVSFEFCVSLCSFSFYFVLFLLEPRETVWWPML